MVLAIRVSWRISVSWSSLLVLVVRVDWRIRVPLTNRLILVIRVGWRISVPWSNRLILVIRIGRGTFFSGRFFRYLRGMFFSGRFFQYLRCLSSSQLETTGYSFLPELNRVILLTGVKHEAHRLRTVARHDILKALGIIKVKIWVINIHFSC